MTAGLKVVTLEVSPLPGCAAGRRWWWSPRNAPATRHGPGCAAAGSARGHGHLGMHGRLPAGARRICWTVWRRPLTMTSGMISRNEFPAVRLQRGPRFVDNGRVATSGGLTSGIDLALHVGEALLRHRRPRAPRRVTWNTRALSGGDPKLMRITRTSAPLSAVRARTHRALDAGRRAGMQFLRAIFNQLGTAQHTWHGTCFISGMTMLLRDVSMRGTQSQDRVVADAEDPPDAAQALRHSRPASASSCWCSASGARAPGCRRKRSFRATACAPPWWSAAPSCATWPPPAWWSRP